MSRRTLLEALGVAGVGAATGAAGVSAATRSASAAEPPGESGADGDLGVDELTDPGGDVVATVDDDGAIDWRSRAFTNVGAVETAELHTERRDGTVVAAPGDDLQARIDEAGAGGHVHVAPGTYRDVAGLSLYDNQTVSGAGTATEIRAPADGGTVFDTAGTLGASTPLVADAFEGDTTVSVTDATVVSPGAYVLVNGDATTASQSQTVGEIHRVQATDPRTDEVTLGGTSEGAVLPMGGLMDDYTTAADAEMTVVHPVEGVQIRDLRVTGDATGGDNQTGVRFEYAVDVDVSNVTFEDLEKAGVLLYSCVASRVADATVRNVAGDGDPYGVGIMNASRDVSVSGCTFENVQSHAVTVGGDGTDGYARVVTVSGNTVVNCGSVDCHVGDSVRVVGNTFSNQKRGVLTGAFRSTVASNEFRNMGGEAVAWRDDATEVRLVGNTVRSTTNSAFRLHGDTPITRLVCRNNEIDDPGAFGVVYHVADGTTAETVDVSGNTIRGAELGGINVNAGGTTASVDLVTIADNTVAATGTHHGILLETVDAKQVRVADNAVRDAGGDGVRITAGRDVQVADNSVVNPSGAGIRLRTDGTTSLVAGNRCVAGGGSGIHVETDDAVVRGNVLQDNAGASLDDRGNATGIVATGNVVDGDVSLTGATVRDNEGYVTETSGVARGVIDTTTTGHRTVTVSHGCDETPSVGEVSASIANGPDTGESVHVEQVRAVGPSGFDVVVRVASASSGAGGSADLAWRVGSY